jgi:ATP-dependent exoDNAse (exonuclease V) alpha subunit
MNDSSFFVNIHIESWQLYLENSNSLSQKNLGGENTQSIIPDLFSPYIVNENSTGAKFSGSKRKRDDNQSENEFIEERRQIKKEREKVRRAKKKQECNDIQNAASSLTLLADRCFKLFPGIKPETEVSPLIEEERKNKKVSLQTVLETLNRCHAVFSKFIDHVDLSEKENQTKIQQLKLREEVKKCECLQYLNSLVEEELFPSIFSQENAFIE